MKTQKGADLTMYHAYTAQGNSKDLKHKQNMYEICDVMSQVLRKGQIFHCYIPERSLHSDGCCLRVQRKPELLTHRSRVQALAFQQCMVV